MKRSIPYKHPTTYSEIVACAATAYGRRMKELKSAKKQIRAIQDELTRLTKSGVLYSVDAGSMFLIDVSSDLGVNSYAPRKRALHINGGLFDETRDRLAKGFIELGWTVAYVKADHGILILQKPKTQTRVHLYVSKRYAESLVSARVQGDA